MTGSTHIRDRARFPRAFHHVFLLHTHNDEGRIRRLADTLLRGYSDSFVLVSHDRLSAPLNVEALESDRLAVVAGCGGRGDFSIVDGYLSALRWLRDRRIDYRWLSNLSGQDYPVLPLAQFRRTCDEAGTIDGFIHHFRAFEPQPAAMAPWTWPAHEGVDRYAYAYRRCKNDLDRMQRALLWPFRKGVEKFGRRWRINPSYGLMLGRFQDRTPFDASFRCYAGSFWHTLNHRCTNRLLDFVEERPTVVSYFRNVLVPDEAFVQTVLANCPTLRLVNSNLRYIDMTGSKHGRPKILSESDLPAIAASHAFFARKFAGRDADRVLDVIDRTIGVRRSELARGDGQ